MSTARRIAALIAALLAVLTAGVAYGLWPLVGKLDAATVEYYQRDVEYGWLLLQAATPLFAVCVMTACGLAVLAWRLAVPRPARR